MPYKDPIIQKYEDMIKAAMPQFKIFYQGDPTRIPASNLPCCIITKRETGVRASTNSQDEHAIGMNLTIVTDIRADLSTVENDAKVIEGVATLYDLIEGRNADYTLKASSVLQVLRTNQLVDGQNNLRTDLSTITRVDYGSTLRNRNPEEWSIEARIEFVAHFIQIR